MSRNSDALAIDAGVELLANYLALHIDGAPKLRGSLSAVEELSRHIASALRPEIRECEVSARAATYKLTVTITLTSPEEGK